MLEILLNGGPFMKVLAVVFSIILFLLIKNINEPYKTNCILLLGIFSALFGILGTYIGVKNVLNVVTAGKNISPEILINGFKTSLITAYAGAIIMFFSSLVWYYFVKKYNLFNT